MPTRCAWVSDDSIYIDYHDNEWGVPVYDSHQLFTMLLLEGMQAGLNWLTILKKRPALLQAFDQFEPHVIACYGDKKIQQLMQNTAIIRNRLKIKACISNAKAYLNLCEKNDFSQWIWQFVDHHPLINHWKTADDVPAQTDISADLSRALKQNGFTFVGPTICYAFMQAVGMVQDHTLDCFRYHELTK